MVEEVEHLMNVQGVSGKKAEKTMGLAGEADCMKKTICQMYGLKVFYC